LPWPLGQGLQVFSIALAFKPEKRIPFLLSSLLPFLLLSNMLLRIWSLISFFELTSYFYRYKPSISYL